MYCMAITLTEKKKYFCRSLHVLFSACTCKIYIYLMLIFCVCGFFFRVKGYPDKSKNNTAEPHEFNHPWFQTLIMFIGKKIYMLKVYANTGLATSSGLIQVWLSKTFHRTLQVFKHYLFMLGKMHIRQPNTRVPPPKKKSKKKPQNKKTNKQLG